MNVTTSEDFIGVQANHAFSKAFIVLGYSDGSISTIPNNFFRNWMDEEATVGTFVIGKCSGLGVGSIAKYDAGLQKLVVGKFVAGGLRVKFLLNGQHDMRTISMSMMSVFGSGLTNAPPPQYGDMTIRNDVWIGDEAMFLGGSTVENGCVIGARTLVPANFKSEPYGIYVGSPARLVRFRFSERIREKLVELAWWDMPISWIRKHNDLFLADLTADEGRSLEMLTELLRSKKAAFAAAATTTA
jgi:virginiamycin A acetyltransferase